jgi:hypothetical protein
MVAEVEHPQKEHPLLQDKVERVVEEQVEDQDQNLEPEEHLTLEVVEVEDIM